jgi:hypothetical protein
MLYALALLMDLAGRDIGEDHIFYTCGMFDFICFVDVVPKVHRVGLGHPTLRDLLHLQWVTPVGHRILRHPEASLEAIPPLDQHKEDPLMQVAVLVRGIIPLALGGML